MLAWLFLYYWEEKFEKNYWNRAETEVKNESKKKNQLMFKDA